MTSVPAALAAVVMTCSALAVLIGCGDPSGSASDPLAADAPASGGDGAAGACLAGSTDCEDTVSGTGGPSSQPDGSVLLADAVATGIEGPFLVQGFYYADAAGERLCSTLAESFPPQCGEPSLALDNAAGADLGELSTEDDVRWSPATITLEGEIIGRSFVTR
jgi:hypothetical protein